MLIHPTEDAFVAAACRGNLIPVYTEVLADFETPVAVYSRLRRDGPSYLLESIEGGETVSRYSFIGCRPRRIFTAGPGGSFFLEADGSRTPLPEVADPLTHLEAEMARYQPVPDPALGPFQGGAVGCIAYDYVPATEPTVPLPPRDVHGLPTLHFVLADQLVVFDRARQTMRLCCLAHLDGTRDPRVVYRQAVASVAALRARLLEPAPISAAPVTGSPFAVPPGNLDRAAYEEMVSRTREFIRAGDIIQAVLSQRFDLPFAPSPLDLYRALRTVNPSPYMFLLENGAFSLVGASPEVHVKVRAGLAELRPIAGTRPRGATPEEDGAFEKDLLADEKERAEHLMLVDLARNDLGRVCEYGSVRVPEFMVVERYSHVMHIVSQVEGRLRPGRSAFDLMRATFPAGTVSGAPKVRAMQIIAELERDRRGPYAGAVAYFSYDGSLDSCIAIRTALLKDGHLHLQAGAGIVADSDPGREYEETIAKARALLRAAALAEAIRRGV